MEPYQLTFLQIELFAGLASCIVAFTVLLARKVYKTNKLNLGFIAFFVEVIVTYTITIILYVQVGWQDLSTAGLESIRYWIFWINHSILVLLANYRICHHWVE